MLGRIRYLGDSYVVVRNGEPVARIEPVREGGVGAVREAFEAWGDPDPSDPGFARDLDRVASIDAPPESPWGS